MYVLQVDPLQDRVDSLERQLEEQERSSNERATSLQRCLERFKKSALAAGKSRTWSLIATQ